MKFKVQMKDPDGVFECREEAIKEDVAKIEGLTEDERAAVAEERTKAVEKAMGKWFEYDEYLTVEIEIDTDAGTCVVVPVRT